MAESVKKLKPNEAQDEYVVGGNQWFATTRNNEARDRVETCLNKQTIDRLRLDAEVESDVDLLFTSTLSDGIEPVSCITDENHPEFAEAQEIADFVKKAVSEPKRAIVQVVKEMGKAAFYSGVKVGEIVLRYQDDEQIQGKLVLDRINPKPNSATAFVTDKFYNVLGLVGAKREGQAVVSTSVSLSKDEIIPREKFLVLHFELEDNDPRGLSQARALFEAWCEKQTTRTQWKEWRRTSAIPKKVGITAQGAADVKVKDANGDYIIVNGVPKTVSPQKNMMTALEGFANNSTIVVPFGSDVKQLEVQGTGVQFSNSIKFNNSEIRKVVLGDALTSGEADKDSRASREVSKDVTDTKKQSYRVQIQEAVKRDIFRLLTVVNFGADKAHLTPDCFLGDTEANDLATDANAYGSLGFEIADEHFREIDKRLGLTPRGKDWRKSMPAKTNDPEPVGGLNE